MSKLGYPNVPPVSRTATAPFDRLKVFLATRPVDGSESLTAETLKDPGRSSRALVKAVVQIYREGGVKGYWVGNGLNILKIFPVSLFYIGRTRC